MAPAAAGALQHLWCAAGGHQHPPGVRPKHTMFAEVSSLPAEVGGESGCSGLWPEFSPDPAPEAWSDAEILPWGAVHADQLMARKLPALGSDLSYFL